MTNVPTKRQPPQVARWCYTLFSETLGPELPEGVDQPPIAFPESAKFAICQLEKCPDSGRYHLQGYLVLKRSARLATLKKIPGFEAAHWEPARGSHQSCVDYCSKDESRVAGPWTMGEAEACGSGVRSDLLGLKRALDDGADDRTIATDHFGAFLRYGTGIARYRATMAPGRPTDFQTPLTVVLGPTNVGKTRWVFSEAPTAYVKAMDGKWFDGYDGTSPILFDDFMAQLPFNELLRLFNVGPYQVEQKNGRINWNPSQAYITSNVRPDQWYKKSGLDVAPLLRRMSRIVHFTGYREYMEFSHDPDFPANPDARSAWKKYSETDTFQEYLLTCGTTNQ